ncbi:hypothetical protein [Mycolicibacterium peregrinum]|uniref:hypothetical protein n=1 Tax=Mycolicibacterium peregrinum TaxID=43304 RepID=UPI003AAA93B0
MGKKKQIAERQQEPDRSVRAQKRAEALAIGVKILIAVVFVMLAAGLFIVSYGVFHLPLGVAVGVGLVGPGVLVVAVIAFDAMVRIWWQGDANGSSLAPKSLVKLIGVLVKLL